MTVRLHSGLALFDAHCIPNVEVEATLEVDDLVAFLGQFLLQRDPLIA